jgi:hypothetical protein
MAKSTFLFPGASLSPDSGLFPFYLWSMADLNGPANPFTIYQPSLFAGVTENTSWDGNSYDFYNGETGNRVFLLLQQHYSHSFTLWSCAAGVNQGTTPSQQLAEFPFTAVSSLAGQATRMEFAGNQVRLLVGATPLVSATTDANGWVTYTGTTDSGRVTAPLGATRFWLTLAGGEKPGFREFVVSDKPQTITRFTSDGSRVTEASTAVTGPLTLTHDATIRARVYSAAAYRSPETVAVFTSTIPLLPAESFVSPAYMEILHATLDGSPALVSLSGPSGTTNGFAIISHRFILRYPLQVNEPTPVTLSRTTLPDLSTNIVWREIDLAASSLPDPMTIRAGDSLLFTAGVGETGTLHIAVMDGSNQVCQTREGVTGETFPVRFDQGGTFTVIASVDGISVGSLIVHVVYIDFDGPVACQVGYKREKGVAVYGPTNQVFFTAKDPALLEVSVKEVTSYGVRLYLKALGRGTPVVQARLGSATGPILAEQEVEEFTADSSAAQHLVVNGETDTANTILTMKPWIPNVDVNFGMYAHYSTFAGGATAYTLNTSDQTSVDINGDPAIDLSVDPSTGETQAVIRVDIEIPPGESSYCFSASFDQHSKYGTKSGEVNCNGSVCKWTMTEVYWGENETGPKTLTATCTEGKGNDHSVVCAEAGFSVSATIKCTKGAKVPISVDKTAKMDAKIYKLKIESNNKKPGTPFYKLCVMKVEITEPVKVTRGIAGSISATVFPRPPYITPNKVEWIFSGGKGGTKNTTPNLSTDVVLVDGENHYGVICKVTVGSAVFQDSATITVIPREWKITPTCEPDNEIGWGDYPTNNVTMGECRNRTLNNPQIVTPKVGGFTCARVNDPNGPNDHYWYIASTTLNIDMETVINKYAKHGTTPPGGIGVKWHEYQELRKVDADGFLEGLKGHEYEGKPGNTKGHFQFLITQESMAGMDAQTEIEKKWDPSSKTKLTTKAEALKTSINKSLYDAYVIEPTGNWGPSTIYLYDPAGPPFFVESEPEL